jgi:hypothetical protein
MQEVEVRRMRIGTRVKVVDKDSEFYGLTVVITDIRVEPKPQPFTIYKVVTEDGLPPERFPFSSTTLTDGQFRPIKEITPTEIPKPTKDYLLIITTKLENEGSNGGYHDHVEVETFVNTTKDEIAERIVKRNIYCLTDHNGTLMFHNNPVKYEVVELDTQPDCINASVIRIFEAEKDELEKQARVANERLKVRLDKLAEFARSKGKGNHIRGERNSISNCPVCGKAVMHESIDSIDSTDSIDLKA